MCLSDFSDIPYTDWCGQTIHNHLDVHSSKFSGISGCSDAVSHGSASSTKSTELVLGKFESFMSIRDYNSSSIFFRFCGK